MSTTAHDATETSNPPENLAAIISHHEHNEQTAETNNNQGDVISNSYDVMSSNDVIISSSDVTINNDVIRKPICDDVMMETSDVMKSNNDVIESTGDMISTNDVTNANFPGKRINGKDGMKGIVESSSRSSCNERDLKGGDNSRNELEKRFADFGNITVRRHAIHLQQDQKILNNIKQVMESMLGVRFGPVDFQEAISDGVHLCHFLNCLNLAHATVDPHKIHPGHLIKNKLQNATLFVDACLNAGLSRNEICTPYDIVEAKNLHIVCRTLQMLLECQP